MTSKQGTDGGGGKKLLQLTRNRPPHFYGQTFTPEGAEQAGIDASDLRELTTDREVKPEQTTKR